MTGSAEESRRIYESYVAPLPDSLTCWRLKLYALTRQPELFKSELARELFRIFNVGERYFELDAGAEYHEALISGFGSLDESVKRDYVANLLQYYSAPLEDKRREEYKKRDGREIATFIQKYLLPYNVSLKRKRNGDDITCFYRYCQTTFF